MLALLPRASAATPFLEDSDTNSATAPPPALPALAARASLPNPRIFNRSPFRSIHLLLTSLQAHTHRLFVHSPATPPAQQWPTTGRTGWTRA